MCVCTWPWDWCTHYKGQRCEENSWTGNSDSWPDQIRHILCSSHHIKYHLPVERSLFLISLSGHRRVGPIGQDVGSGFIYFFGGVQKQENKSCRTPEVRRVGQGTWVTLALCGIKKASEVERGKDERDRCSSGQLESISQWPEVHACAVIFIICKQVYICRWTYF